jgi:DNA-binding NtrC family response regulator
MQQNQDVKEKTILIVDDDRDLGEALQSILEGETPYRTLWLAESDLALVSASYLRPALIFLDYRMPVLDGLHLYDQWQKSETMRGVPVILISGEQALPYAQLEQRQIRVLKKPFDLSELLDLVAQVISG